MAGLFHVVREAGEQVSKEWGGERGALGLRKVKRSGEAEEERRALKEAILTAHNANAKPQRAAFVQAGSQHPLQITAALWKGRGWGGQPTSIPGSTVGGGHKEIEPTSLKASAAKTTTSMSAGNMSPGLNDSESSIGNKEKNSLGTGLETEPHLV